MIVCELQPSGFTFAAHRADQAVEWAKGYAAKWPSTAVRLFDFGDPHWSQRRESAAYYEWEPKTLTVPL